MTNEEYAKLKHKAQLDALSLDITYCLTNYIDDTYGIGVCETSIYWEIIGMLMNANIQFKP
jgi:hypothetical protein